MNIFYSIAPLPWIIFAVVIHLFSRRYSANGSFLKLLIVLAVVYYALAVPSLLLRIIAIFLPIPSIIWNVFTLWNIYLQIVAVSVVYSISLKRGSFIFIVTLFLFVILLFALWMGVLKAISFSFSALGHPV